MKRLPRLPSLADRLRPASLRCVRRLANCLGRRRKVILARVNLRLYVAIKVSSRRGRRYSYYRIRGRVGCSSLVVRYSFYYFSFLFGEINIYKYE